MWFGLDVTGRGGGYGGCSRGRACVAIRTDRVLVRSVDFAVFPELFDACRQAQGSERPRPHRCSADGRRGTETRGATYLSLTNVGTVTVSQKQSPAIPILCLESLTQS